jgi:hypothetical protein
VDGEAQAFMERQVEHFAADFADARRSGNWPRINAKERELAFWTEWNERSLFAPKMLART